LFTVDRTRTLQNPTANQSHATKRQKEFFETRNDLFDDNTALATRGVVYLSASRVSQRLEGTSLRGTLR